MTQKQTVKLIELIDKDTGKKEPYVLELNQLGKGFYGTVFKAVHQFNPNMVFAVKVIKLQNQSSKNEILKQLEIIQKIPRSPNLVDTHKQHLQSGRNFYIFQEYCEGGSLADFRERNYGRLMKETQIYDIFYQLGKGYLDMYKAGIIHEDIKPSNILIKGPLYKYCDFGVSQLASNVKHSSSRRGTISYMPPQKLRQKFIPNPKSDIYSLGVTLYEVIFGFHPYLQKKTKIVKQYIGALNQARLRPIHQLLKKVYNPSMIFYTFVNILEGMISLKADLRIGIQQLTDILTYREPFRDMKIPKESEMPKLKQNSYEDSESYQIISKSKIIFMKSDGEIQNRLINYDFEVNLQESSEEVNCRQETLRLSKIKQEEEKITLFNLLTEHRIIQAIVSHLSNGAKIFKMTYQVVETDVKCREIYFNQSEFKNIEFIKEERVSDILNYLILKLNIVLIASFGDSVQNFQKIFQEIEFSRQAEYLQAELSKFIAEKKMKDQTAKSLMNLTKSWTVQDFCQTLIHEFNLLFRNLVLQSSIRINFKNDLLNGIFLIHINSILQGLQLLPGFMIGNQNGLQVSTTSSIVHSQKVQKLDRTIKNFNIYKTLRIEDLKNQFYKQFEAVTEIIYDFDQNSGEFISISDLISEGYENEEDENLPLQQYDVEELEKLQ